MRRTAGSRRGGRRGSSERAFTLVELLVVIVVIGIVCAALVPEFRGTLEEERLRAAARELVAVLDLAYSESVTTGRPHRVRLDPGEGAYRIEARGGEREGGQAPGYRAVEGLPGARGRLPESIELLLIESSGEPGPEAMAGGSSGGAIGFRPDGTADPCRVLLRARGAGELAVEVVSATGRVRVTDAERRP